MKGTTSGNCRPITCLPTMFKLLASKIADNLQDYLEKNHILPVEQKGNKMKKQKYKSSTWPPLSIC